MNWKKLLKISAIAISSVVVVFGLLGVWLLTKLPGPSKVKEVIESSTAKLEAKTQTSNTATNSTKTPATEPAQDSNSEAIPSDPASNKSSNASLESLKELANPDRPLADVCRDLGRAGTSGFFPRSATTRRDAIKFFENIVSPQKDPVLESITPIMRFVFRSPGMSDIVKMYEQAGGEDSLWQKAEFYTNLYRAVDYVQKNIPQMNQLLQKSYNLHMLSKAVALKPQLANDNATRTFCEQMEQSLVTNQEFNAEEQVQEMQKFLQDTGIEEKSIGFDPKYRAHVQSEFGKDHFTITDAWLKELTSKGML